MKRFGASFLTIVFEQINMLIFWRESQQMGLVTKPIYSSHYIQEYLEWISFSIYCDMAAAVLSCHREVDHFHGPYSIHESSKESKLEHTRKGQAIIYFWCLCIKKWCIPTAQPPYLKYTSLEILMSQFCSSSTDMRSRSWYFNCYTHLKTQEMQECFCELRGRRKR